jgi:ribulose 1,5-bisphosphate synthetase/thiazole synthase
VSAWLTKLKPLVCIIGAGPIGLTAISELKNKSYKTIIFKKQLKVGKKYQAYYKK